MPNIRTIEEDFEYQTKQVLTQFVKDFELSPANGEELFKELWDKKKELGELVYNQMSEWMDSDDWLVLVQEN